MEFPRLAPRRRPPTHRAHLSPPGGARTPACEDCTRSLRAPAAPPGLGPGPDRLRPRALPPSLPRPCRGGVVARLRRLTRELERPGQHGRHGGGPGARARARVLPGSVVPSGRCAGLGPAKVGAPRRGEARRSSWAAASASTFKRLQALLPPTRNQAPYLAGDFTSLSLSSSVKWGDGNSHVGLLREWNDKLIRKEARVVKCAGGCEMRCGLWSQTPASIPY